MATLRWFAVNGVKGLYVVEYVAANQPFAVWIKWGRGFWENRLRGLPAGLLVGYQDAQGRLYFEPDGNVPQADLDLLWRGVRAGWHASPPDDFFAVRFPTGG